MTEQPPPPAGKREYVVLAIILSLAALLRFADLDAIRYNTDNAYPVWQALDIIQTGNLPRVGPATLVFIGRHPILSAYLYLPLLAIYPYPTPVYIAVIFFNLIAVVACYFATKSLFRGDTRPAFIATWMMAVNPWVIFYSRQIWPPGLLPFYLCTLAWLLFPVFQGQAEYPKRRLLLALLLTTMLTQTTLIGFIFLAPLALALALFYKRISVKVLTFGAVIFAVATTIFLSGLPDAVDRAVDFATDSPRINDGAALNALRLASGADFAIAYGGASLPDVEARQSASIIVHFGIMGLFLVGMALAALAALQRKANWKIAVVVLGWQIIPVVTMSYTDVPVHLYYLLITLPAGYWLIAWGCQPLLGFRFGSIALSALLLAWGAVMAVNMIRSNQEAYEQPSSTNLWALPLRDTYRLGEAINAHMPSGGTVYARMDSGVLATITGGQMLPVVPDTRWPDIAIIPHDGGLYIDIADPNETILPLPFSQLAETITLADQRTIHLHTFDPLERQIDAIPGRLDIPSEQGLTLCCYELFQNRNNTWILQTYWLVEQADPLNSRDSFGTFTHIFDANGQQILNLPGQIVAGYDWRVGDIHVHRVRFRLPENTEFTLRVGQYDPNNQRNIIFVKDGVWSDTVEIKGESTR